MGVIMIKETLTKDIIKAELKKIYFHDILKHSILLSIIVIYFALYPFKPQLSIYYPKEVFILIVLAFFYLILISVKNLFRDFRALRLTEKNNIEIKNDVLIDKGKKTRYSRYRGIHNKYQLFFEKSEKYTLKKRNYECMNLGGMSGEQVYNSSEINDEFYIVSVGKWKNILAYNKKMFEFK